jgi:hypothetical protein
MRIVGCVAAATLALILSTAVYAAEWSEYSFTQDFFMATFPEKPKVEDIVWKSEYGVTYPARLYTAMDGASKFTVTVVNLVDAQERHRAQLRESDIFDQGQGAYWQIDIMSSMPFVATQYRRRPGVKVTEDAFHYIDLVAGHQLHLANPDGGQTHVALYLHKNRLFVMDGTVPKGRPAPAVFTESLQFIDQAGQRVRYRMIQYNELPPQQGGNDRGRGAGPAQGQQPAAPGAPTPTP